MFSFHSAFVLRLWRLYGQFQIANDFSLLQYQSALKLTTVVWNLSITSKKAVWLRPVCTMYSFYAVRVRVEFKERNDQRRERGPVIFLFWAIKVIFNFISAVPKSVIKCLGIVCMKNSPLTTTSTKFIFHPLFCT